MPFIFDWNPSRTMSASGLGSSSFACWKNFWLLSMLILAFSSIMLAFLSGSVLFWIAAFNCSICCMCLSMSFSCVVASFMLSFRHCVPYCLLIWLICFSTPVKSYVIWQLISTSNSGTSNSNCVVFLILLFLFSLVYKFGCLLPFAPSEHLNISGIPLVQWIRVISLFYGLMR